MRNVTDQSIFGFPSLYLFAIMIYDMPQSE